MDISTAGRQDLRKVLRNAGFVGLAQLKLLVYGLRYMVCGLGLGVRIFGLRCSLPSLTRLSPRSTAGVSGTATGLGFRFLRARTPRRFH